jgi:DNA-binding winged helix-turn-helix (wHTH) protein
LRGRRPGRPTTSGSDVDADSDEEREREVGAHPTSRRRPPGAHDCLRAALRRAAPADEEAVVETEHFTVDLAAKRVTASKGEVHLTPTEWQIVELLVRNAGKLVTQRQLLQEMWGPQSEKETNYLRVYMAQIRSKLEPDPSRPRHFITEARMGYRFELEGVRQSAAAAWPADPAEANRSRPGADVGVSLPGGRPGLEASAAWRVCFGTGRLGGPGAGPGTATTGAASRKIPEPRRAG